MALCEHPRIWKRAGRSGHSRWGRHHFCCRQRHPAHRQRRPMTGNVRAQVSAGKVNSRWPGASAAGSPASRCAPTAMKPSWLTSNASSAEARLLEPGPDRGGQISLHAVPVDRPARRTRQAGQGRHRGLDVADDDVAEQAAHHDDPGGDRTHADVGDPGVGLQHLDAVQPSHLRRLPRHCDVALVHLDQPGRARSRRGCPVRTPITSRPWPAHRLISRMSPAGA